METKEISIPLTVAQWNVIMGALGTRPFIEVADLIADIKAKAAPQMNETPTEE